MFDASRERVFEARVAHRAAVADLLGSVNAGAIGWEKLARIDAAALCGRHPLEFGFYYLGEFHSCLSNV